MPKSSPRLDNNTRAAVRKELRKMIAAGEKVSQALKDWTPPCPQPVFVRRPKTSDQ